MNENPNFMCIDAGSENCPCSLAESGNCIVCGRLSGKDCSDCRWHGVCIYNEYIQNNRQIKKNRVDIEVKIESRILYDEDTILLGLHVGKGYAVKCYSPGSFVFLRRSDKEQFYNFPISVMYVDVERGLIFLLLKGISVKTKAILSATDTLIIRGPYKNGLFGMKNIEALTKSLKRKGERGRILIAAKATGVAPAVKMIQWLGVSHDVVLLIDCMNLSKRLFKDIIPKNIEKCSELDFSRQIDMANIKLEIASGRYDCLIIFASDHYIDLIGKLAKEIDYKGIIAVGNNFNLCCGEGICGACSVAGKNGETLKMCKCRMSGEDILERKIVYV